MGRQIFRHKSSFPKSETEAANFKVKFKLKTSSSEFHSDCIFQIRTLPIEQRETGIGLSLQDRNRKIFFVELRRGLRNRESYKMP